MFSVTLANLETITDMKLWCRTWLGHSMDPGVSVQKQNFTKNPEKLAKVPGTREETKSFTLTIPWNSAKIVKIFPGNLHVYTTQIGD